ncbi:hypothetical protein CLOSTMETH_00196 [[Clostridium] methylpentosum DSM 5476]|uniref:Uncharacterized protein n=1 Tax=[Clostridium] methylpentosum DSM 5476 TaxID=537013 RepID=C0E8Q2_9FIRM|nr:hypothetical protein CLOSTMETH_00196 [[Clostridium] methylpentosum DSM 5476]
MVPSSFSIKFHLNSDRSIIAFYPAKLKFISFREFFRQIFPPNNCIFILTGI